MLAFHLASGRPGVSVLRMHALQLRMTRGLYSQYSLPSFCVTKSQAQTPPALLLDRRRNRLLLQQHRTLSAAIASDGMGVLHNDIEKVLYKQDSISQVVRDLGK